MKTAAGCIVAILGALTLQVALSRWLPGVSERLDLLLVVVVYYGASGAQVTSMLAGAAAGLMQDVWFGGLLGRSGFRKVLTGYLVGAVGARFSLEAPAASAAALALATLADHATGVLLGQVLGLPLADAFSWIVLQRAIANALLGTACFAFVRRLSSEREGRATGRTRRVAGSLRTAR